MILLIFGTGIVCLGIGLFLGKLTTKPIQHTLGGIPQKQSSLFQKWVQNIKDNKAQKDKEKQIRKQLEIQAREQALKNMQPALVKHMEKQELKKMTGEDKKDKLNKFANMFAMGSNQGSFNTTNKLNNMLGIQQPIQEQYPQSPQQIQQQPMGISPQPSQTQQQPMGISPQPSQTPYTPPQPQFDINKILGNSQKGPTFNSVNEQILGGPQGPTFNSVNKQILGKPKTQSKKKQTISEKMAELLS